MKSTRKLVAAMFASLLAALPGWATGQSGAADTVYTFCFVSDRDMFYVPYGGNDAELERLIWWHH